MHKLISILFLFLGLCSFLPKENVNNTIQIATDAKQVEVDNLGNIYLISEHEIKKYKPNGTYFGTFSTMLYGEIASVDVSNPLKILLFFNSTSTLQFLDNMHGKSFSEIALTIPTLSSNLAATSYNSGYWIYNASAFELSRYDANNNPSNTVNNIHLIINERLHPNFMCEKDNYLYLNDPESGIFVFDIYGTFYKKIPIRGLMKFNVQEGVISYFKNNYLLKYSTLSLSYDSLEIKGVEKPTCVNNGLIFELKNGVLKSFLLNAAKK